MKMQVSTSALIFNSGPTYKAINNISLQVSSNATHHLAASSLFILEGALHKSLLIHDIHLARSFESPLKYYSS